MKKWLIGGITITLVASGLMLAPSASAGCVGGGFWGIGGTTCDGPVDPNGWFMRCVSGGVGWIGGTNCYPVDITNMAGQHIPWRIPG